MTTAWAFLSSPFWLSFICTRLSPLERATVRTVSCWQWSASEQTSALVRSISDRSLRPTGISHFPVSPSLRETGATATGAPFSTFTTDTTPTTSLTNLPSSASCLGSVPSCADIHSVSFLAKSSRSSVLRKLYIVT